MGYRYDPQYLNYEVDFNTVLFGVHKYKKEINIYDAQGKPRKVEILYFRNIEIDDQNRLKITVKPSVKAFANFEDYRDRLSLAIQQMTANAKDSKRHFQYGMVTTISKGYDAPCCAVIAKETGCDTAVTFKPEGKYAEDCGTEIAKALGYTNVIERDAMAFKGRTDNVEALYVATGELGADISFCTFDAEFTGNLVFTGDRGDSVWGRNATNRNNEFAFDDVLSHLGCIERRLWLGYIAVPMPLYGASAWTSLFDIANSDEMKAWQMDNNYDRPIPRRIVETAGVPREAFGIQKHGAGFIYRYDWLRRIVSRMSETAGNSFMDYVKKNKRPHPLQVCKYIFEIRDFYMRALGLNIKLKQSIEYSRISNALAARYLIPWAGDVVLERYNKVLREEKEYEYFTSECGNTQ